MSTPRIIFSRSDNPTTIILTDKIEFKVEDDIPYIEFGQKLTMEILEAIFQRYLGIYGLEIHSVGYTNKTTNAYYKNTLDISTEVLKEGIMQLFSWMGHAQAPF